MLQAALLLSLGAFLSCAVNPVTGKREFILMSESQEIALGQQSDPQIVATYGLYGDPELAAYVDGIGQKLAAVSHRPQLKFTFRILDSPVINAFALPGGYVYVTRGILAHMNNESELAVVLGHEIGHVTARHGAQQQSRATLAGLGLGVGSIFSDEVARFGGLAQSALGILFLKYGRDDEHESDQLGVQYSLAAGFDPERGAKFFEVLDRQSQESGQSLPGWLSTHPAPADRVERTSQLARDAKGAGPYRVGEATFKERIDGVVFGEDPRQGFMDGNVFKHPDLRFRLQLPRGWRVHNTPSAVVAIEPDRQAQLQMTLEPSEGLSPSAYVRRVAGDADAVLVEGGAERIGGYDAYAAVLRVGTQSNAVLVQLVAIQRKPGDPVFQIIGAAGERFRAWQTSILAAARSFGPLDDAAALGIQANHVEVVHVGSARTLQDEVSRHGNVPVPLATIALLNNLRGSNTLNIGFQLKIVRGTFQPESAAR
jgi:predicted Zn-dependent protease